MENQFDTDNQDLHQVEQSSTASSTFPPKKHKINLLSALIVLLFILFVFGVIWFVLDNKMKNNQKNISSQKPTAVDVSNQIVVTGVLRTSGLRYETKQNHELSAIRYQVTDFGNHQNQNQKDFIAGYYLLADNITDSLLGKCVRAKGTISDKEGIDRKTYNRAVLRVLSIEKTDYLDCSPYSQIEPTIDKTKEKLVLNGTITHLERPSPDFYYDYELKLTEPFVGDFSSAGGPAKLNSVVVVPATNNDWITLENNIGKKITVEGYMTMGFAESEYLQVISVKADNNPE